jgi:hypothetical protein
MKLSYSGIYNPILSHFTGHFSGNGHSRQARVASPSSPATTSRFHFRQAAPHHLKGDQWQLKLLGKANAALAYEATLNHPTALQQGLDYYLAEPYTWQTHIQQIERYEQEQEAHKSFSFIVLNSAATQCLGMVRVMPLRPFLYYNNAPVHLLIRAGDNAAMITYWLADCTAGSRFPCEFIQSLHRWFSRNWEFDETFFRINPEDSHCLAPLTTSGLTAHFSLKVPPISYTFYGN